jgi:hypothetical protein
VAVFVCQQDNAGGEGAGSECASSYILAATVGVVVVAAGIHGREGMAVYVCQQDNAGGEDAGREGASSYILVATVGVVVVVAGIHGR